MLEITKRILSGDVRALARGISYVEDHHPDRLTLLKELHPHTRNAYKLGITGAPGAGKSSLVNRLVSLLRAQSLKVGVIGVDPTSPFTGGALLGDRVRMSNHFTDPGVYIRSMGTRGSLGGLARATKEAVHIVDAYGVDIIIIETVGVGQSELDIMKIADTTAVVLTPNGGDSVQAFKAGIMEIADLYVINKADIQGADKLKAEIDHMLDIVKHDVAWRPPILKTISTQNQGLDTLWTTFQEHRAYLVQSGIGELRQQERLVTEMKDVLLHQFYRLLEEQLTDEVIHHQVEQMKRGQQDPFSVAEQLFQGWKATGAFTAQQSNKKK